MISTAESTPKGAHLAPAGTSSYAVAPRATTDPAPTITGGGTAEWGERATRANGRGDRDPSGVRVTPEEAATLQSYPSDMVWVGAKSKTYLQIGNAVPPLLVEHIATALWGPGPAVAGAEVIAFPTPAAAVLDVAA